MVWFYPCFFVKKEGICVQKLDYINSLSTWPNIVPNTISLMVTSKYLKISTNTMRRIEVFMGLNLYKIKIKTNILLIPWHVYFIRWAGEREILQKQQINGQTLSSHIQLIKVLEVRPLKLHAISNINNLFDVH